MNTRHVIGFSWAPVTDAHVSDVLCGDALCGEVLCGDVIRLPVDDRCVGSFSTGSLHELGARFTKMDRRR